MQLSWYSSSTRVRLAGKASSSAARKARPDLKQGQKPIPCSVATKMNKLSVKQMGKLHTALLA